MPTTTHSVAAIKQPRPTSQPTDKPTNQPTDEPTNRPTDRPAFKKVFHLPEKQAESNQAGTHLAIKGEKVWVYGNGNLQKNHIKRNNGIELRSPYMRPAPLSINARKEKYYWRLIFQTDSGNFPTATVAAVVSWLIGWLAVVDQSAVRPVTWDPEN
uniref:Uncharacterized protein n=1 Tax=Setaria digitata TaxID=48799 RepID=A0A915Q4C6_9BILA